MVRELALFAAVIMTVWSQLYLDQLLERERGIAPREWELEGRPSVWFRSTGNRLATGSNLLLSVASWIQGDDVARALHRRFRLRAFIALMACATVLLSFVWA